MNKIVRRILKAFGLITIDRARKIHVELAALTMRSLAADAHADFGVPLKPDFEKVTRREAAEAWDTIIRDDRDEIIAMTEEEARRAGYIVEDGIIYMRVSE
jgi:hypothetical protein